MFSLYAGHSKSSAGPRRDCFLRPLSALLPEPVPRWANHASSSAPALPPNAMQVPPAARGLSPSPGRCPTAPTVRGTEDGTSGTDTCCVPAPSPQEVSPTAQPSPQDMGRAKEGWGGMVTHGDINRGERWPKAEGLVLALSTQAALAEPWTGVKKKANRSCLRRAPSGPSRGQRCRSICLEQENTFCPRDLLA